MLKLETEDFISVENNKEKILPRILKNHSNVPE